MIIHHHLGLGDHFVCNGLVNFIANQHTDSIDLICKKHNFPTVEYLYSENNKINVVPIECKGNELEEVNKYALSQNKKILRIGFQHCDPSNWDQSFYKQAGIDFIERYQFFKLPKQKPNNLIKVPDHPYILVHNESSGGKYNLSIQTKIDKFYITRQEGYHLLSYIDIITSAQEIHCIDSSVFHLIDSMPNITNKLYFHDIRKSNIFSFNRSPKWRLINY
jgi:hypothetical protein